jgi:hypothetical protein
MATKKIVKRRKAPKVSARPVVLKTIAALKQGQVPGLHAGGQATDAAIEALYKANSGVSLTAALRAVWNAGWYEGAGVILKAKV